MNRHYSYFIIKPDGIRFINQICNTLEEKYPNIHYFSIDDYEAIIKELYHKHYETKGEKFTTSFDSYLYGIKQIFGNYGILVLVADEGEYQELVQSVFDTKIQIRSQLTNDYVGIVTNYANSEKHNYLRMLTEDGRIEPPRIMQNLGNYRISDLNVIHCPDPTIEATLDELGILSQRKVIDDRNMIREDILRSMRRYRTANFQEDMRLESYAGLIQPDISGFFKEQIKKEREESGESR